MIFLRFINKVVGYNNNDVTNSYDNNKYCRYLSEKYLSDKYCRYLSLNTVGIPKYCRFLS